MDRPDVHPPNNGIYFDLRSDGNGGHNWFAVTRANGSTMFEQDTGEVNTGSFRTLQLQRNAVTDAWEYWIDGRKVAETATGLPGVFVAMNLAFQSLNSATMHDYVSLCFAGLQR